MRTTRAILIIVALSFLLVQCSRHPTGPKPVQLHQLDSLDALLLKSLETHKVVIVSDALPAHCAYEQCIVSFLRSWLATIQHSPSDTTIPHSLILALDVCPDELAVLEEYCRSGDRFPLIRFLVDEQSKFGGDPLFSRPLSTDFVHFCDDLRSLRISVDSLNMSTMMYPASLQLAAGEPDPPYTYADVQVKPRREFLATKQRWDAAERCRLAAARVIRSCSDHPESRILFFANGLHALRDAPEVHSTARYLDSLLGRNQVSVFQTSRMPRTPPDGPQIEEYRHNSPMADYIVRMIALPQAPFPFYVVKSQNTLRALVDLAESYSKSSDTLELDSSRKLLGSALQLLRHSHLALRSAPNQEIAAYQSVVAAAHRNSFLSSSMIPDIRRLIAHFDAVQDIAELDSVLITFTPTQEYFNDLVTVLDNLPSRSMSRTDTLTQWVVPNTDIDSIKAAWAHTWKTDKRERKSYMLLQLLWIGTQEEVRQAIHALQAENGLRFETPEQWDDWWRSKY